MLLSLSVSGATSIQANSEPVDLRIMYYHGALSETTIQNAIEQFPDYNLDFQQVPADDNYDMQLRTSLNSDSAADIVAVNDNIQDFKPYYDRFVNLLDYGTGELESTQVEWKWDSTLADDGNYQMALPLDIGPTAMFYHVGNFEQAGLPTDPDEVTELINSPEAYMEAAKQMKEQADIPMFQSGVAVFSEQYQQMTERIYDEEGNLTFANGQLREVWDFTVEAIQNEYTLGVVANSADGVNTTAMGLFGSKIQASWGIADLTDSGANQGEWQVAGNPGNAANQGGSYLAVLNTTNHPAEATEVIMYLTGEESQRINYVEQGLFPTITTILEDETFADSTSEIFGEQKYNKYFIESANSLEYIELDPRETGARRYFEDQIKLIEEQGKDPEQAWNDAVNQVEIYSEG
ncbi:ABC transporter substrate-binding protein [Fundicoccus culcitae]|uniref:Extracellular solute-binding protein n=1 Tax=Fundicoccus culcitae TaxID=2969821 RepID=A0ABY5PA68_9LACT|nr:extracellular solute-binding protein [Fundicoccus culcitae]UUX35278.1 extracellular solute-binding protein [Fundicoccus culcitae]